MPCRGGCGHDSSSCSHLGQQQTHEPLTRHRACKAQGPFLPIVSSVRDLSGNSTGQTGLACERVDTQSTSHVTLLGSDAGWGTDGHLVGRQPTHTCIMTHTLIHTYTHKQVGLPWGPHPWPSPRALSPLGGSCQHAHVDPKMNYKNDSCNATACRARVPTCSPYHGPSTEIMEQTKQTSEPCIRGT